MSVFFYIALVLSNVAMAEDFFRTAETMWFDPADGGKVDVSLGFVGMNSERAARIIAEKVGGRVEMARGREGDMITIEYHVVGGRVSPIKVGNLFNERREATAVTISAKGLAAAALPTLQLAVGGIAANGGMNLAAGPAFPMRVSVHLPTDRAELASTLVNLARNYTNPAHNEQIRQQKKTPELTTSFTPGMRAKLRNASYQPSLDELYADIMYRQPLERLGVPGAATMSIADARAALAKQPEADARRAMGAGAALDLTGALAAAFPTEPASRFVKHSGSPKATITYHNNFDVQAAGKETLGVLSATRKLGAIDHDRWVSQTTGLGVQALKDLRKANLKNQRTGRRTIFRYFLADPNQPLPNDGVFDYAGATAFMRNMVLGRMSASAEGRQPLVLRGDAIVQHGRTFHRNNIVGQYNPSIANYNITQALTSNKYVEAKFFEKYAPGAMAETELLGHLGTPKGDVVALAAELKRRFPNGWILKESQESNSGHKIVTDSMDIVKAYQDYQAGDFAQYRLRVLEEMKGRDEDEIFLRFQEHKDYLGYKVAQMLENPNRAIVQRKLSIDKEFRVEVFGGRVLGKGSTVDRFFYLEEEEGRKPVPVDPSVIRGIEDYTQKLVDGLPAELRGTPFAFDIALLKNGSYAVIESNAGPESGFLTENPSSITAINNFLRRLPKRTAAGEIAGQIMDGRQQMKWLGDFFHEYGIDAKVHYPNYKFLEDHIDVGFAAAEAKPQEYTFATPWRTAELGKRSRRCVFP